jgi:hypothetical protein
LGDNSDPRLLGAQAAYIELLCLRVILKPVETALKIKARCQFECLAIVDEQALPAWHVELVGVFSKVKHREPWIRDQGTTELEDDIAVARSAVTDGVNERDVEARSYN